MLYFRYYLYTHAIIIFTVKYDAIKAIKVINNISTNNMAAAAASFAFQLTSPVIPTPSSSIYLNRKTRSINCDALFPRFY